MTARRLFSVEEANAVLPQLETLLSRLIQKKEKMDRLHDELFMSELLQEAAANNQGHSDSGAHEVDARVSELEQDIEELRALGCILRNLDAGWVEFPAQVENKTIYLCWKKGESAIRFYRPLHAAFAERLPL